MTTSACHWRKLCCGHYDDLLDLLALLHRPHFIRRETLGVFLQQRHRQTSFGISAFYFCIVHGVVYHSTRYPKGESDYADPLPLLLHFAVSTKQRSEATGTFIWHFLSVFGFGRLISLRVLSHLYFGRPIIASLVFWTDSTRIYTAGSRAGIFWMHQHHKQLGRDSSNYRAACDLISAFFSMLHRTFPFRQR